jgi:DNA repair protein RecO (recombination protein O)
LLSKLEGIVLKAKDYGESHQILLLFTEHRGKLAVMARGSKKPRSRFSAVTEPFTVAHFVLFSSGGGMPTLSQADLIQSHHALRSDLLLTAYGAYWLDLVDHVTEEKEANPALYRLLKAALDKLEQGVDPDILTRIVELRMLTAAGAAPVLQHCVHCRQERRPVRFSVRQGGFLCEACAALDPHAAAVSEACAQLLPLLQKVSLKRLGEIRVRDETRRQLEELVHAFVSEHVAAGLKSYSILQQFRGQWG